MGKYKTRKNPGDNPRKRKRIMGAAEKAIFDREKRETTYDGSPKIRATNREIEKQKKLVDKYAKKYKTPKEKAADLQRSRLARRGEYMEDGFVPKSKTATTPNTVKTRLQPKGFIPTDKIELQYDSNKGFDVNNIRDTWKKGNELIKNVKIKLKGGEVEKKEKPKTIADKVTDAINTYKSTQTEAKMTEKEKKKKEEIVMSMKKKKKDFENRY